MPALEPGGQLGEQASTLLQQTVARVRRVHARARRAHVSNPTITHDGHITLGTQRIDPNSPIFIAAASACRGKLSGSDAGDFFSKLLRRGR
jgi:hypothetical protein